MSRTITNFAELSDPVTASIDAQTAALEAVAACQGAGISSIYNTPLCGDTMSSAEDLAPTKEPCCVTTVFFDDPEPGDTRRREECDDGSSRDIITYANGNVCEFPLTSANPSASGVILDENCQEMVSDAVTACKPRILGEPYDRYFIPLQSDFGNQVYCIPGASYAFAWSGVKNANLVEFLADNAAAIDLEDPNNQYVAIVAGDPYVCGQDPAGTQQNAATWVAGQDALGNDYYCFPFLSIEAHTTNDPTAIDSSNVAFDNMGNPISCPPFLYDPLQLSQETKLEGAFSPILSICDAWDGEEEEAETGTTEDGDPDLSGVCGSVQVPDIKNKTYNESYIMLWQDYWKCEKKNKTLRNVLLAVQGAAALAGLVTSIKTYNQILDKNLDIICDVQEDIALRALCSRALVGDGTEENPGIIKECQTNLLANHNDRIGTINSRGKAFCEFAQDEIDCYEQLWRPLVKREVPTIASELHTMLHNGKLSSEYTSSWADGLQDCVTENMLPELKRQFAPLLSSVNCTSNNLNEWRSALKQDANELQDHYNRTFKPGETTMIPAVMDMSTCMVQRVCELRDWLYDVARCDLSVYKEGYQQGEIPQAQAAMATAAQLIPKVIDSVCWLETNIAAATELFRCYKEGIETINPRLFANAGDLAPEIQVLFRAFKDNADQADDIFKNCYKDRECQIVHKQMDLAIKMVSTLEDSLCRLDNWSVQDRKMYDDNFRSHEINASTRVVLNGQKASDETHDFGHWWDERTKEFHTTYHQNWLPCDIENLKRHCEVWNSVNPLQKIEANAAQMERTAQQATDLYDKSIIHAETYMDEVFKRADTFDFCIEDQAVHHIRQRIDTALEELTRCTPKYATGHREAAALQLKVGGAQAEGAAFAAAARWKWWANEQLDQRDHDRRMAMLGLADGIAARGFAANAASTAGHDLLLRHMREAISRGNIHTANMQDSGRNTISINGNEVDAMLRMVQLWHFWPELAASENGQFNSSVHQLHGQARDLAQLGHFWPGQANQDRSQAANVAESAIATGVQLSQIGQYYLTQADAMNDARATMANSAGVLGNQFAQTGHNLHRLASDQTTNALQQSIAGAGPGLQAGNLGAQHMATALEVENTMTLNALEHLKAGISSMALGVDFLSEVRQTQQLAGSYGVNAAQQLMNLFETGRRQSVLGMEANAQCRQTEFDMLCKAKEFAMQNHQVTTQALHGGVSGTLNASNNLLQQQGQNAGSAFALLGNSVEGLLTSNNSPPAPTGGPTFTGGGGFF